MRADYRRPISVCGPVTLTIDHHGRLRLLRNEVDEWELPEAKLEPGESPERAVIREGGRRVSPRGHHPHPGLHRQLWRRLRRCRNPGLVSWTQPTRPVHVQRNPFRANAFALRGHDRAMAVTTRD